MAKGGQADGSLRLPGAAVAIGEGTTGERRAYQTRRQDAQEMIQHQANKRNESCERSRMRQMCAGEVGDRWVWVMGVDVVAEH